MKITLSLPETRSRVTAIGPLTRTETLVLKHLIAGMRNIEIANATHTSVRTVETHHAHVLKKLKVKNTVQAALWGYEALKKLGEIKTE